jgi:hypothetical protein
MNPLTEVKTNPNSASELRGVAGGAAAAAASAKPTTTTGAIFSNSTGMPRVFKSNFDYQLVRAMSTGAYGDGGAVGEVYSTARRVVDGDLEGWTAAWLAEPLDPRNYLQFRQVRVRPIQVSQTSRVIWSG